MNQDERDEPCRKERVRKEARAICQFLRNTVARVFAVALSIGGQL